MSKDKIFHDKPKVKKISPIGTSSYPFTFPKASAPKLSSFRKDEINLDDYDVLDSDKILQKGDIYWDEESQRFFETNYAGRFQPIGKLNIYYRKKQSTETKKYIILNPRDIIQEGDEFRGTNGRWERTGNVGDFVDTIYQYRRLIKEPGKFEEVFTERELEKARKYYKVRSHVPMV